MLSKMRAMTTPFVYIILIKRKILKFEFTLNLLSPVKPRDIGLDWSVCPSVCPSVRLSHPEGGCLVDITSPSLDMPRGFFSSYSMQTRIIGVQRQGFSLVGQKLLKDYAYNLMWWAKECCEKSCQNDVVRKTLWERNVVRMTLWESRCEKAIVIKTL